MFQHQLTISFMKRKGVLIVMKKYKLCIETYIIMTIYLAISIYLIYQKNIGQLVYADFQLFLVVTVLCFGLGFFSFFNMERNIRIAGLIFMILTLITTSLYLLL